MPLKAIYNDVPVFSYNFNEETWAELKRGYRQGSLLTSCCQRPALPRTSPIGTRHFAHKTTGHCQSRPETREHLLVKHKLAVLAQAQGWQARTEEVGSTPDGEQWIADVFCEKGTAKVALEVQLASQSDEETLYRQLRYRRSGVRAAWFVKYSARRANQAGYLVSQDVPQFAIEVSDEGAVFLPQFGVGLDEFVAGMLSGDLKWVPAQEVEKVARFQCFLTNRTCHHCLRRIKLLLASRFRVPGEPWEVANFRVLKQLVRESFDLREIVEHVVEKPFSTSWQQLCPNCGKVIHISSFGDERQWLKQLERSKSPNHDIEMAQAESSLSTGRTIGGYWKLKDLPMRISPGKIKS